MLREERSESAEISLAKIENELNVFSAEHTHVKTELVTSGDLSRMRQDVWLCIFENMQEALVNMLKHSESTLFRVEIEYGNRLVRAAFSDNGGKGAGDSDTPRRGIGLQNMEERCALCYGRIFFRHEPTGFRIVMTFPLRDDAVVI